MVSLTLVETVSTINNTKKLPILEATAKATSSKRLNPINPGNSDAPIIKSAAPKLAPELIPSTKGPARGFRNKVCIKSPLSESPPPTKMAVMAFGSL